MYILTKNGALEKYPYSPTDLRRDNPGTSFPKTLSDQALASWGVFPVIDPGQPAHDPFTQTVDEFPPAFVEVNGQWERQWAVRAATAQEIADRQSALIAEYTAKTQERLDSFAQTRGYDGILSAATYASSPTPQFAAEGQRCVVLRDSTWATLYAVMADVQAGNRAIPSWEQLEAELPAMEWN